MLPQQERVIESCCGRRRHRSASATLRPAEFAAGGLSVIVWMLLPKCPVCLAAVVALWTGLGLSFTQAASVRWALIGGGVALTCYVAAKVMMRMTNHSSET
jgi:hypothetical protein